jgi:hypothetical protein
VTDCTVNAVCHISELNGTVGFLWNGFRVHLD